MSQKYTSANTSINSTKLPKIYGLVKVNENETVLDYGCGKFFDSYNLGNNYYGYDPYNRNVPEILNRKYDVALCSNVLNVIAEREVRVEILNKLKGMAKKIYVTVYEGNKTGISKETKKDCFQLNWKHDNYIPEFMEVFGDGNVKYSNGCFECGGVV